MHRLCPRTFWLLATAIVSLAIGLAVLAAGSPRREGRSFAFLVGVEEYDKTELRPALFAVNDIVEFRQVLLDSGFKENRIVMLHDKQPRRFAPEGKKIRDELKLLLDGVEEDDTIVVALAGHGIQFEDDKINYFCPIDAKLDDKKTLVSLNEMYDQLESSATGRKLLLVDACRNDPQSQLGRATRPSVKLKSVTRPQIDPVPEGIVALFSCRAGQQSFGDPDLKHGVFFNHVIEGWRGKAADKSGRVTLDRLVTFVKDETQAYAREKLKASQTPSLVSKFDGVWVLADRSKPPDLTKPVTSKAGSVITNSIGMKLATIPAGEFMMGAPDTEQGAEDGEKPQHRVRITKPYSMGVYEVTQAEYEAVMKTNPSWFSRNGGGKDKVAGMDTSQFPVETVSWDDAVKFCQTLSALAAERQARRVYRLPTEAEWEYACRARRTTPFHFGSSLNGSEANVNGNHPNGTTTKGTYLERTTKVGSYPPNAFGLFDMHGNVEEWCSDFYDAKYYEQRVEADPPGPATGGSENHRVVRGGSWYFNPRNAHSAARAGFPPDARSVDFGFRVVCVSLP